MPPDRDPHPSPGDAARGGPSPEVPPAPPEEQAPAQLGRALLEARARLEVLQSAHEELRVSAERYRTVFDSLDEGFCLIEVLFDDADQPVDYRFLEVNRVFEQQTGIGNAVGRRMREISPAHEEHWFQIYGHVARTGEPRRFENAAVALGRFYEVYALRAGRPEQRQVALLFTDITARRRAEEERGRFLRELREADALLRADLDATHRLLKISSLFLQEGNLEAVLGEIVDAAIAITGAELGELRLLDPASGRLALVAHRNFPAWWLERWRELGELEGACGAAVARQAQVLVEDIEASPLFAGTPALDAQREAGVRWAHATPIIGRVERAIGVISTSGGRSGRPAERALGLVALLARQTGDILERAQAERALEEANRRLFEADRRKTEFLGMLSHELRNPLAPIRNSIHLLERATPGGEQARRAQAVIDRQVGHLTHLVDDLLDITRITSGKIQLQREALDLNELVQRTTEDHRGAFAERKVALVLTAAPAAVWVHADRTRLAQVIGNLLQNAVKFTPAAGETSVTVEVDALRGGASVSIRDTGIGIEPALLPRLFEPFAQGDTSLDRSRGGLGLGLAVVKGLVEMHGGSVRAESAGPGRGATFTIALPLETAPAAAPPPAAGAARAAAPRRVLIIDDNIDAADTLRDMLELAGHEVEVAYSGPEGLAKARAFAPSIVLCDIGLPEMDGYEVARAIRADPALGPLTLVALTGYAGAADVARAHAAGFDAHLAKPLRLAALEAALAAAGA
jgi:signal transduction histidine kinase